MLSNKTPKCKYCSGGHYQTFCPKKPKKAMTVRKPLKASTKPFRAKTPIRSTTKQKPVKRAKLSPQSKSTRSLLIRKADRIFSIFIRRSYAVNGMTRCVTCSNLLPWRDIQNGHFIPRRKMQVRWDEKNCHPQCSHCNETLSGNLQKYKEYLIRRYGEDALLELQLKAEKTNKLTHADIQAIIDLYTGFVDNLSE